MARPALKVGTLVVLEGLDRTGKTTQARALKCVLDPDATEYAHMPEGFTDFTRTLYAMLESDERRPASGIARQLAHLACHAEAVPRVEEGLRSRAVVLDRWWWSNVAYGWYGGDIHGVTYEVYTSLLRSIWAPLTAAVVFVFDKPVEADANNSDLVHVGYQALAQEYPTVTARVPDGDADTVTAFILSELEGRGLLVEGDSRGCRVSEM